MAGLPEIDNSKGQLLNVSARDPFLITGSDSAWVVKKGSLDIFYVTLKDSEPYGSRHHICRFDVSEAVLGIPSSQLDNEIGLLAVPNVDTQILKVDSKAISSDVKYSQLVDNWLTKLSDGVYNSEQPAKSLETSAFYSDIFKALNSTLTSNLNSERERLENEENYEQKRFTDSFARLANVLETEKKKVFFRQASPNEIFNACDIVGRYLGIQMRLDESQKRGMDVKDPVRLIARASRVRERKITLDGEWWLEDLGAFLGFLDNGSPVALIPVKAGQYKLLNPADNTGILITSSVASHIRKDAYTFYRPLPYKPVDFYNLMKFGLKESKNDLWMIVIVGLGGGLLGLLVPYFTGLIFQDIIPSSDRGQLNQLIYILVAAAFATGLFQITRSIATLRLEGKMNSSVQAGIWDRLLKLPVPFFRNYTTGNLAVRALGIDEMLQMVTGVALTTILTSIFSMLNFIMLYYYDPSLAIWATIMIFAILATIIAFEYNKLKYLRKSQVLTQNLSGLSYQLITGMEKIRVSGAERTSFSEWTKVFAEERENEFKSGLIENRLSVFFAIVPIVSMMVIFFNIAFVKDGGTMDTGTFVGFNAAFTIFLTAMIALGQSVSSLIQSVPIYENLRPIIETLPEVDDNKPEANELKGDVEISNVVFKYSPDAPEVLKGISLKASPGEFVAIVGPSGAGKSTLFRLLLGFDKPESGAIFYDGVDLSTLDLQSVRRQFGVVLQDGKLIPGPIFTNIIGSSNLTMDDAWQAAEMAGIADDIKKMPMQMFTLIDDDADTISGGQKQRIMIARAIVNRPKILLFDEATSALDNISQDIVTDSVEKLNATRLVIAHRLSTVIKADRLYVLDEGQIVEEGTYKELMEKKGKFYDLAKRQLI